MTVAGALVERSREGWRRFPPPNAVDECVLEEVGEPLGCVLPSHRMLQLRARPQDAARRLADGQKQILIEEMSKSIGTNGAGLITCILGDSESAALAWDLVDVFRRAGWDLPGSGLNQTVYSAPIRGVIVKIHSREEAELPQVKRLIESLYRVGLERTGEIDPKIASGEFQIIIGSKPD